MKLALVYFPLVWCDVEYRKRKHVCHDSTVYHFEKSNLHVVKHPPPPKKRDINKKTTKFCFWTNYFWLLLNLSLLWYMYFILYFSHTHRRRASFNFFVFIVEPVIIKIIMTACFNYIFNKIKLFKFFQIFITLVILKNKIKIHSFILKHIFER